MNTPQKRSNVITDDYEIGKELGRGTYSVVKVAKNKENGKNYAVKIIKKKLFNRPEFLARETEIMTKVKHPNIVSFYGLYEDKERVYFILELINGGDLFDKIEEVDTFTEEDASKIVKQILEALKYLHSEKIVHRDIKVDNILCDKDLNCYIADFGLSRHLDQTLLLSKVGSLEYTAPEVFTGKGYTEACDLWSVGVVTFILLTGTFPFSDSNPKVTYEKITKVEYDWEEAEVSNQVLDFVDKLLVKDPSQRLTADQALGHPWIANYNGKSTSITKVKTWASKTKAEKPRSSEDL